MKFNKEENYERLHKPLLHRMLPWLHIYKSYMGQNNQEWTK